MRIQPAVVRVAAFLALADVHHGPPPGCCKGIILVITTIVKRYMRTPRSASALHQLLELARFVPPVRPVSGGAPFWCTVITIAPQAPRGLRGFFNGLSTVRNDDEKARGLPHAPRNADHHRQSHRQVVRNPHHAPHHPPPHPPPDQTLPPRIRLNT